MKIKINRVIEAPSHVLWNYLADYSNIDRFHPLLASSEFVDGANSCEVGSTRQCNMKDGNYIKERVIDWKEGSHYSVEIYDTSMPMKSAQASIGVKQLDDHRSEVYFHMDAEPKYKIMQPMMYLMFKYKQGPTILKGLEELYKKESQVSLA